MMTLRGGGAANIPGKKFVIETKDSSKASRLIPFIFNAAQTYDSSFFDFSATMTGHNGTMIVAKPKGEVSLLSYFPADDVVLGCNLTLLQGFTGELSVVDPYSGPERET